MSFDQNLNMSPDAGKSSVVTFKSETDPWDISDGAVCLAASMARAALPCSPESDPVRDLILGFEPSRGIASRIPKSLRYPFLHVLTNMVRSHCHPR
jgi:hypothetical protein